MQNLKDIGKKYSFDYAGIFFVALAIILGGMVRFYPALRSDFPLNDGGLFYQMTQDLLDHRFVLPVFTTYNNTSIPFSYPPLAFYVMAFIKDVFGIGIITQLQFLPALISTLTIPAFYFLSRSVTGSKVISTIASYAYALLPASFVWLIMGGGITRSLGLLFAILALIAVLAMCREPRLSYLLLSIAFCSLTVLSHPEIAWFLFLSSILVVIFYGMHKKSILYAFLTAIGVLLLTSPWWITILHRFGFSQFLDAFRTAGSINLSLFVLNFSAELFASIILVLAFIGIFSDIARRKFFVVCWLLLITIFLPRSGITLATIPIAMLYGSGFTFVLIPGLLSYTGKISDEFLSISALLKERISKIAFGVIVLLAFISALLIPIIGSSMVNALSPYDRQAMEWIAHNTPVDAKFVVLTGGEWYSDYVSEWFPALAQRNSVATVQGSEWMADNEFSHTIDRYQQLQSYSSQVTGCNIDVLSSELDKGLLIYIDKSQFGDYFKTTSFLGRDTCDQYQLLYENPGAVVIKVDVDH